MKKTLIIATSTLFLHNAHGFDLFTNKMIVNVEKLTLQQKNDIVPIYAQSCAQNFTHAKNGMLRYGLPATVLGVLAAYCGMASLDKSLASACKTAGRMNNYGAAILSVPFELLLNGSTWKGAFLTTLAIPCFLYAGYKLLPLGIHFIKSRSFYAQSLYGLNKAIHQKMGYPRISYTNSDTWVVTTHSGCKNGYDLRDQNVMQKIFDGNLYCKEIAVPQHQV